MVALCETTRFRSETDPCALHTLRDESNNQSSIILHQFKGRNAVYYYHYDGLGSVVALSDAAGDTVQLYEYSVYGQVAASDPNHPNPFLFTGRRFDTDTGLYYYRARYYNPYIGRFLQTDPVGYGDGMNMYRYCANNPAKLTDPSGMSFEEPTGKMMILPWRLDPGMTTGVKIIGEIAGAIVDLVELTKIDKDIRVKAINKLLEALEEVASGLANVPRKDRNGWRVFIETAEYADADDDGVADVDDDGNKIELRERSWVEIRGVRHPRDQHYREHGAWDNGSGYRDPRHAWVAGSIGMKYWPYRIPEGYIDPGLSGDTYGKDYWVDNKILDAVRDMRDIIEKIKDTNDILE